MKDETYNGWANYETWVVKLWMDNDQGSADFYRTLAKDYFTTDGELGACGLAEAIKDTYAEQLPNLEGFAADLMSAAMSEVNWREIAEDLLDEVKADSIT